MAASTTVATISNGTDSVDVLLADKGLEHDYDKQISSISVPKSEDPENTCPISTGTNNPLNYNIDLKRLKQVVTVTGYLLEETASSALTKKDALEKIMSNTGNLTLQWLVGTTTITKTGTILKCKITEQPYRIGAEHPAAQSKSMMITLSFVIGVFKG